MRILGIDSSTPKGSVALLENHQILSQSTPEESSNYSRQLLFLVDLVLTQSGSDLSQVDGIAVTIGPGSFTGLRVGISLVKGIVMSSEIPFAGIPTLEAVAAQAPEGDVPVCAVLDARKKEVYAAFFQNDGGRLKRLSRDSALVPEELCERVTAPTVFVGPGLETYGDYFSSRLGKRFVRPSPGQNRSTAAHAAMLAQEQFHSRKSFDLNSLEINYVRKSEAETQLKR